MPTAREQRRALQTRRVYALERKFQEPRLPIEVLRDIAEGIWKEGASNQPCPTIVAGRGMKYGKTLLSFCRWEDDNKPKITLSRHQRQLDVMIHELTHALVGRRTWHGPKFVKKYFELLVKWAGYDKQALDSWYKNTYLK